MLKTIYHTFGLLRTLSPNLINIMNANDIFLFVGAAGWILATYMLFLYRNTMNERWKRVIIGNKKRGPKADMIYREIIVNNEAYHFTVEESETALKRGKKHQGIKMYAHK